MAVVEPSTGNILEWRDAVLMQVRSKVKAQEGNGETTQVAWDMRYKKRLAEEFGTSKSKRKINQMLSNTINT